MTEVVVFPLYGVECLDCGQPGEWFVDGLTLPCRCGARRTALTPFEVKVVITEFRDGTRRKRELALQREENERRRMAELAADANKRGQMCLPLG